MALTPACAPVASAVAARQAAFRDGITTDIRLSRNAAAIRVSGGIDMKGWNGELRLLRPDDASIDQIHRFPLDGAETTVELPNMKDGLWLTRLHLSSGGRAYYFESKEMVAPNRQEYTDALKGK